MKSYLLCVLSASVISAVFGALWANEKTEKYMKYVTCLVCAAAVIFPIAKSFDIAEANDILSEISVFESSGSEYAFEKAENSVKSYIAGIIYEKFGITPDTVIIDIYSENNETVVSGIKVILKIEDKGKAKNVESYLSDFLGAKTEVE